jgi:hypothetical protein
MALVTSYLDGSGSPSTSVVAVAALVTTADKWEKFSAEWSSRLPDGISALHMKHFCHSLGEFSDWKGDEPRRARFLNGLLWAIEEYVDFTAACAVHMADYNAVDADYAIGLVMRPYTLAALTCSQAIIEWSERNDINRNDIAYIFEKGDNDQDDLRKTWTRQYPHIRVDPIFLRKCDVVPGSATPNKVRIRPFEAGDFVAYENLRGNQKFMDAGDETVYFDELRKPLQRMRKLPGSDNWRYLDKPTLEKLCRDWNVPRRPVDPASLVFQSPAGKDVQ